MVRLEQPEKNQELVEGGVEDFILIFVKPVQPRKQEPPKLVTELGIVIEVKPVQPSKQLTLKLVTELGIVVFLQPAIILFEEVLIIALQFSLES